MFQRKTLLIAVVVLSVLLAASALLTVPPDSYTRFMVYIPGGRVEIGDDIESSRYPPGSIATSSRPVKRPIAKSSTYITGLLPGNSRKYAENRYGYTPKPAFSCSSPCSIPPSRDQEY